MQCQASQDSLASDRYLTVAEVARLLNITEDGVRYRLRRGILPGVYMGSKVAGWRVSERELAAWLAARHSGPVEPSDTATSQPAGTESEHNER